MADLLVRTGIDARGFKRGLYVMEKDLGDADRRMSSRFGGDMGGSFGNKFWGVGKGAGKFGKSVLGISPGLGVAGAVVSAFKLSYDMIEQYEQKLPESARKTLEVSRAWENLNGTISRGSREFLPDFLRGVIEIADVVSSRASGRLGALFGMLAGGTSGPGQIDDFLKEVEYKQMREGSREEREVYLMRRAADAKRLQGDALGADLLAIDADKKEALSKLPAEAQRLHLNAAEADEVRLSIVQNAELARAKKIAEYQSAAFKDRDEESKAIAKAHEEESERERKAQEEARKAQEEIIHKREDAQVDIYEAHARFRNAKATTDEEKKSAEEARAYAKYKREELAIKRQGLDADQENELSLYNQAEYEATIEAIRARQDDKPKSRPQAPDGLDLSSAGAFASQGQAMAFQIPGKIDRTNVLLQQSGQTLQRIEQKLDSTARFAP